MFLLGIADAAKEGDGGRVLRCWGYLLPLFTRKNYSIEVLKMLYQCEYELTPCQAKELTWERFVYVHQLQSQLIYTRNS